MSNLDAFYLWSDEHNYLQNIKEYDDITKEFEDIKAKVIQTKNLAKNDEIKLEENVTIHWKRIISDACSELTKKVESRKIRVQLFSDLKSKIGKLWGKSEKKNLGLEDFHRIWSELKGCGDDMDERIIVEKHQLWLFFGGLGIGFILGILASILVN